MTIIRMNPLKQLRFARLSKEVLATKKPGDTISYAECAALLEGAHDAANGLHEEDVGARLAQEDAAGQAGQINAFGGQFAVAENEGNSPLDAAEHGFALLVGRMGVDVLGRNTGAVEEIGGSFGRGHIGGKEDRGSSPGIAKPRCHWIA